MKNSKLEINFCIILSWRKTIPNHIMQHLKKSKPAHEEGNLFISEWVKKWVYF